MTFTCSVLTAEAGTFLQCHSSNSFTTALLSKTRNPRMPKHMISAGTDGAGDDMMARAVMVKMLSINNLIFISASYLMTYNVVPFGQCLYTQSAILFSVLIHAGELCAPSLPPRRYTLSYLYRADM